MSGRTPLGRVRGYGAAKEGVGHWWVQRLTSVALVPLGLWLAFSLLSLPALDHATVIAWMGAPGRALLLMLLVSIAAWHSQLGVQVVIEDYVHGAGMKVLALVVSSFAHVVIAAAGVLAVLSVSLRSAT
jgi:succinate dehydrogenase / fumarate reductase membrane anchor subunit